MVYRVFGRERQITKYIHDKIRDYNLDGYFDIQLTDYSKNLSEEHILTEKSSIRISHIDKNEWSYVVKVKEVYPYFGSDEIGTISIDLHRHISNTVLGYIYHIDIDKETALINESISLEALNEPRMDILDSNIDGFSVIEKSKRHIKEAIRNDLFAYDFVNNFDKSILNEPEVIHMLTNHQEDLNLTVLDKIINIIFNLGKMYIKEEME